MPDHVQDEQSKSTLGEGGGGWACEGEGTRMGDPLSFGGHGTWPQFRGLSGPCGRPCSCLRFPKRPPPGLLSRAPLHFLNDFNGFLLLVTQTALVKEGLPSTLDCELLEVRNSIFLFTVAPEHISRHTGYSKSFVERLMSKRMTGCAHW